MNHHRDSSSSPEPKKKGEEAARGCGMSRRRFLERTALWTAGMCLASSSGCRKPNPMPPPKRRSPNERLGIACIGVGGRGRMNVPAVASEDLIALCDVDDHMAADMYRRFPQAKQYRDFRKLFDELHAQIDAVVISTPDHMHALPALIAMQLGINVYCEKPLGHDLYEARLLAETARRAGVVTQMGIQGASQTRFRQGVDLLRAGVLGKVQAVHLWTDRPDWPQGMERPLETPPVPPYLDWDLFLGTAPARPYHPAYHPFKWRGWWDFGTGALGDMGCHLANLPFMGLEPGPPATAEALCPDFCRESFPPWSVVTLTFPAKQAGEASLEWTWYDGKERPAWVAERLGALIPGETLSSNGAIIQGAEGTLYAEDAYGASWRLLPMERFADVAPPEPRLPESPGHYQEWIQACKGGPSPLCGFEYAGPLTELVLLGNLALRAGKKIEWDSEKMRALNCPQADALVRRAYRPGWTL